ncbi:hypothetical protein AcW1_010034 [Taiwanofungus camphoratus]|nr:hypothetical protein AcV7_005378 [Antrodia cinnamomea]KAI0946608.1 hypothetical protein AcW1_010034 [Antrodia cinnamomea]
MPIHGASSDQTIEVALAITAEIPGLSDAGTPFALDIPLTDTGLTSAAVLQLYSWLRTRFDWEGDVSTLLRTDVTAELLARDIVSNAVVPVEGCNTDPHTAVFTSDMAMEPSEYSSCSMRVLEIGLGQDPSQNSFEAPLYLHSGENCSDIVPKDFPCPH